MPRCAAERAVRRDFRSADDAEPRAIGREDPRAARARAEDAALGVHLHPVGHAVGLVGRHVGEDAAPDELAVRIDFEGMDVLRPPRVGYVEHALVRSEEHTSELQSPMYLVCRLLLEKKNYT